MQNDFLDDRLLVSVGFQSTNDGTSGISVGYYPDKVYSFGTPVPNATLQTITEKIVTVNCPSCLCGCMACQPANACVRPGIPSQVQLTLSCWHVQVTIAWQSATVTQLGRIASITLTQADGSRWVTCTLKQHAAVAW